MARLSCGVVLLLLMVLFSRRFSVFGKQLSVCDRVPIHTTAPRTPGDNGFSIQVKGLPTSGKYIPGETYTVVVRKPSKDIADDTGILGIMMVAVPAGAKDESVTVGNFSTPTDHVQKAEMCDHTVLVHHYLDKKRKIKIDWEAPDHGCVEFRATVISEDATQWFKDDGGLTLKLCDASEEQIILGDATPQRDTPECCACGEARYKMVFQGLWSRQTHPKDFPSSRDALLLHWSNIVGATHTEDYYIWEYGGFAERGVREVCEYGYSSKLESDMKKNSDKIYTVIKTTPMWRDVLGKREAVFKVNQKAHLLSLLTMIGPSPDWCVGIPSVSMCNANCTWADNMVIELFPWDAGTDDGTQYVNPRKIPSDPPERIHRITNMYPKHPNSPFYGASHVKPMATVTLTKLKEVCGGDEGSQSTDEEVPSTEDLISMMKKKMMMTKKLEMMKCATTEWTDWTECSNNCGTGIRQRNRDLLNEKILPSMCTVDLMQKEQCEGKCMENVPRKTGREKLNNNFEVRQTYELDLNDPCVVTPWSDWSPCSSKICGRGVRERWRMFLRKSAQLMNCGVSIMEKDVCFGVIPDCRKAFMMKNFTAICSLPKNLGPCRGNFQRWYYDGNMRKCLPFRYGGCRGNDNRFETDEECKSQCTEYMDNIDATLSNRAELTEASNADLKRRMMKKQMMTSRKDKRGPQIDSSNASGEKKFIMRKKRKMMKSARRLEKMKLRERRKQMKEKKRRMRNNISKEKENKINCMVTEWSSWEQCTQKCGTEYVKRTRMIKLEAQNGGRKCPKKLERRRKCRLPKCPRDCKVSDWNAWSECTATCGTEAIKERIRKVLVKPKFDGMDCPSLVERQSCNLQGCKDQEEMKEEMKEFLEAMQANPPYN